MAKRLQQWVLTVVLLGGLTPGAALAQSGEYTWVWDDFSNGFTVDAPGAKWFHFASGVSTVKPLAKSSQNRVYAPVCASTAQGVSHPSNNAPSANCRSLIVMEPHPRIRAVKLE